MCLLTQQQSVNETWLGLYGLHRKEKKQEIYTRPKEELKKDRKKERKKDNERDRVHTVAALLLALEF